MAPPYKRLANKKNKILKVGIEVSTSAPKSKEIRNEVFDTSES